MTRIYELRPGVAGWNDDDKNASHSERSRVLVFAAADAVLPVLALELLPNWSTTATTTTLTITGQHAFLLSATALDTRWTVRLSGGALHLDTLTMQGGANLVTGTPLLSGTTAISLSPLAHIPAGPIETSKQFLLTSGLNVAPLERPNSGVAMALVRSRPNAAYTLAITTLSDWRSSGSPTIVIPRASSPITLFRKSFVGPRTPMFWVVQSIVLQDNSYRQTLSIIGAPGQGLLEAWNLLAIEARLQRQNSLRPTFIPEIISPLNLTEAQTGKWAVVAIVNDDDAAALLQIAAAHPIQGSKQQLTYRAAGVRPHAGNFPDISGRVIPAADGVPIDIEVLSLDIATLVRLVTSILNYDADGGNGPAQIAFKLAAVSVGVPPAIARLRFDEFDLSVVTGADTGIPERPQFTVATRSRRSFLSTEPGATGTSVTALLSVTDIRPGGDGLAGRRSVDDDVTPSLVVPLRPGPAHSRLDLTVSETPRTGAVDTVIRASLTARPAAPGGGATPQPKPKKQSPGIAIVLGNRPSFLMAVTYPGLFLDELATASALPLATWTFDPNPPGGRSGQRGWTPGPALTTKGDFQWDAMLPAQTVGEEMERAGTLTDRVDKPIDFRVGDPAKLSLRVPATVPGVNRLFPWNAFRVFMDPLNAQGSAVIESAHLELLFGMPCDVSPISTAAFVLMDPLRRVGLLPLALPCNVFWTDHTQQHSEAYRLARSRWANLRSSYTTRLLLLEPVPSDALYRWEPGVLPASRLSCTLWRPDLRDMQPPVADPNVAAPGSVVPLRGGAAWGIEQAPIYRAVFYRKDNPADPNTTYTALESRPSVDALMSELSLSSVGGSGHVSAGYRDADAPPEAEPATRISADVSYGKLARYIVTRRGRIGVFGHPALHVSVFERTTVPSDQFGPLQPKELTGRAIMRKVAEFIEVSVPTARLARSAAEEPAAGFVGGCAFQPNVRINVRTDWGSDVGKLGWKVPLWNRAASVAQPTVYPRPDVSLLFATQRDPADRATLREHASAILNPDVMCFFTRTDGANADSPEPVESVDFTLLPTPVPKQAAASSADPATLAESLPDDHITPAGFESFTFQTDSGDDPVLITANRSDQREGVRARVHSVTVVRGPVVVPANLTTPQREWADQVIRVDEVARMAESVGAAVSRVADTVLAGAGRLGPGNSPAAVLAAVMEAGATGNITWPGGVDDAVKTAVGVARKRYKDTVNQLKSARAGAIELRKKRFQEAVAAQLDATKAVLRSRVDDAVADSHRRIRQLVDRQLAALTEEMRRHASSIDPNTAVAEYNHAIEGIRQLLEDVDPDRMRIEIERVIRAYVELSDAWVVASVSDKSEARRWITDLGASLSAMSSQLTSARPEWMAFLAPVASQLDMRARTELDTIAAKTPQLSAATFRRDFHSEAARAASRLRAEVNMTGQTLNLPVLSFPQGDVAVAAAVAGQLRAAHELYMRLESIRAAGETRVRNWGSLNPSDAARKLEDELRADLIGLESALASGGAAGDEIAASIIASSESILTKLSQNAAQASFDTISPLGDVEALARTQIKQLLDEGNNVEAMVRGVRERIRGEAAGIVAGVSRELKPYAEVARHVDTGARLIRALGDPPTAQEMSFVQSRLGYVFPPNDPRVIQLSTTVARVCHTANQLGGVTDELKAVGIDLPVNELRNGLLRPAEDMLRQFDFNKIFKDLGGMRLAGLFANLKMPALPDKVRVRHELDAATRRVRVYADVNELPLSEADVPVFDVGVLAVVLRRARVSANVSIDSIGVPPQPRQQSRGNIVADWCVLVGGSPVVTLRDSRIEFSQPGGLHFDIDPTRIELADTLRFLTELMAKAGSDAGGLIAGVVEKGFEAVLSSQLPALTIGTFAITNLAIGVRFALERDNGQFTITVGAFVGRRSAPFALTVFILGGGGFLEVDARYVVGGAITCRVALGINAAAVVGVALGPIRGTVFAAVGFALYYTSGAGGSLNYEIFFLLRGTVSVLSLITVCVEIGLSLRYDGQRFIGEGTFRCTIKIGFFKMKVSAGIHYELGCVHAHEMTPHGAYLRIAEAQPEQIIHDWAVEYINMYV